MISSCKCKHEQQDKLHGNGMRVFNPRPKDPKKDKQPHRCSVCGTEKEC